MKFREFVGDTKLAYHDELNPKLWHKTDTGYMLDVEVTAHLKEIAKRFIATLSLPEGAVRDIVLTGSNANYNWTIYSDVDVHIELFEDKVADCDSCVTDLEGCLQAKKSLWNDHHDITIHGFPVEVYVTTLAESLVVDQGSYSLLNGDWLRIPQQKPDAHVNIDSPQVKAKMDELAYAIDNAIDTKANDPSVVEDLTDKIWRMRSAGIQAGGEFSIENLTFKALRNNGYLDRLKDYVIKSQDRSLSLESILKGRK